MPVWSDWVTFILGTLVAVLALGASLLGWRRWQQPLRLGLSIHPHLMAGYNPALERTFPNEMLQLDITNVGRHTLQLEAVRMRLGNGAEAPAFNEALGEQWALDKPLAPGAHTRVACSDTLEHTLDTMQALIVRTRDGREATLGRRAIERAQRALATARQ